MVLKVPNVLIKSVTFIGMGYLTYSMYQIARQDKEAKKLNAYKEHRKIIGEPLALDQEKQKVQDYIDNHYGSKILERMRTQHLLEEQIQYAIKKKKELREKLVRENSEEEINKIEEEIQKMNELYIKVQSKKKVLKDQSLIKGDK